MINVEFNAIRSREVKNIRGYIHSENPDGTLNVCFNLNTIYPQAKHLHKYTREYLEKYYTPDGTTKWVVK